MSSIFQLYTILTTHPGSFLDYSAWISLRTYKSSDTGPCPINTVPATECLWIAKYIFDYVTPYLPEAYAEHDISLLTLNSSKFENASPKEFSRLVYLVNRHLILDSSVDFSGFDNRLGSIHIQEESSDAHELQNTKYEQIIEFQQQIGRGATDKLLALFLILCLATHANYNIVAQHLKNDSKLSVKWDEDSERRLVEMFETVFPAELAVPETPLNEDENEDGSEVLASHHAQDSEQDIPVPEDEEDEPLLSVTGEPNQGAGSADDHPLFQKSFDKREVYLRVPLPKKGYKAEKNWVALGFQGSNPTTDFRATGQLGFRLFENFCLTNPAEARNIMAESGSFNGDLGKAWYSVALVSIHITLFIQKTIGGRFLYRGLLFNLDLLSIYKDLVSNNSQDPENVDINDLLTKLRSQTLIVISNLHNTLMLKFHKFWRSEVKNGTVKTALDVDASLIRFQESLQYSLFDGNWGI